MNLQQHLRSERALRLAWLVACGVLLFLAGLIMCPPVAVNDTYADNPAPTTDPSITVTTAGTIALDLMPTSSSGAFAKSSAGAFSVATTNTSGYTLKIRSIEANGTDLKYTTGGVTYTIPTLTSGTSITETVFSNSSTYNNMWGYKPSKLSGESNSNYRPIPGILTEGDTLDVTEQANTTANLYDITLGARANYSIKAGSYTNTFEIQVTANVNTDLLTVIYDGNGMLFSGASTNVMTYDVIESTETGYAKYAHTENFEDGNDEPMSEEHWDGYTVKPVMIAGADYLAVNLKYGLEEGDGEYLFMVEGYRSEDEELVYFFNEALANCNFDVGNSECISEYITQEFGLDITIIGGYTGSPDNENDVSVPTEVTDIEVTGDAVTFVYIGGGSGYSYGYYATVEGYDSNNDPVEFEETIYAREVSSGSNSYAVPSLAGANFLGWSTDQNATSPTYTSQSEVEADLGQGLSGGSGDVVTLYAIYSTNYTIHYIANGNNDVTGAMENQTATVVGKKVTLWPSNFARSGYGFAGWNTAVDGTGTNYGPNETITMNNTELTLYAKWITSVGNFQTVGDSQGWDGCGDMGIGDVTALTDIRDNQVYAVAKLADGNCWMIENLRLADTHKEGDQTVATTINSNDTHNPASSFTALAASSNSWCLVKSSSCTNQSKLNTVNTNNLTGSVSRRDTNIYAYGNYYNWYSATAGNGIYEVSSGNTAGDICPAGWSLPTGGNGGQFAVLNTAVNSGSTSDSTGLRAYPANFVSTGYFDTSSVRYRGSGGSYWSSTAGGSLYAYYLYFDSGYVNPGTSYYGKYTGYSVRCVLGSRSSASQE